MLDGVLYKNATGGELLYLKVRFSLCAAHDDAAVVTGSLQGTRNFGREQTAELRYVLQYRRDPCQSFIGNQKGA
jgi:hypothetical protein